jgi:hypothetical protein
MMIYIAIEELLPSSRQYGHKKARWFRLCGNLPNAAFRYFLLRTLYAESKRTENTA